MSDIQIHNSLIEVSDEQLEQIILLKYYTDINYFTIINEYCESRFFMNKSTQKIYNVLNKFYAKYNKMPTDDIIYMIFDKFKKQDEELSKSVYREFKHIKSLKIEQDEDYVKDGVIRFLKHKRAYFSFMDNIDGVTIKGDVSSCLKDFQKILTISFNDDMGFDYFDEHENHRENLSNPDVKIPTGYAQIDKITYGGIPKDGKSLFVIVAQPGLGKSMFMGNMAANFLKQGLFSIIITLEMSEEMYGTRIDALLSELNINELRHNLDPLKDKVEGFKKLNQNAHLLIKEYPPNTVSTLTIQNYIEKVINIHNRKPDVIIIDYINLLKPNGGSKNQGMYEKIGDVTRELRALSYIYGCTVVTATQSNRSGYNTSDVSMDNISESSGIAHTADFIGNLWRQEGDDIACRINMKVIKNRLGGQEGTNLNFHVNKNILGVTDIGDVEIETTSASATDSLLTDLENI